MRKSNIATGIFFLVLSIFAGLETSHMEMQLSNDQLGPAFWPKWLCVILGILSLLLILSGVLDRSAEGKKSAINFKSVGFKRVAKISGLMVVFAALIFFLGIYVGIAVMMPICMYLHGERKPLVLVLVTVGMGLFIFLTFGLLLKVPLPTGMIF